jgi:hypothetical protein
VKDNWLTWNTGDPWIEGQQASEEGRDLTGVQAELDELSAEGADQTDDFQQRVNDLMDRIQTLPRRPDYEFVEPSDLDGIRATRPDGPRQIDLPHGDDVLADKIHGAWLGRCAGCLLGKPVEGARTEHLHPLIRSTGAECITDYIWRMGPTQEACDAAKRPGLLKFGASVAHMPRDDDTDYTIIGMGVMQERGIDFTPGDVANYWMRRVPLLATCTAERVAYRNFANQIAPPASASVHNPYREWIGAQIRADFFGYVALGRPELAAELAWRDASISHVKNGIYGEMWVAAMLAAAAVESDPRRVIELGLSEVPATSRFARDVQAVLGWHAEGTDYDQACQRLHEQWDEHSQHHWCHTNSNAQIVAMGLLWSEGDFEKAITRSVWPGFDTDCNGATVGSVMGMILGAKALPEKWTALMNDTVHTSVAGYNVASISGTAKEMFDLYAKLRQE